MWMSKLCSMAEQGRDRSHRVPAGGYPWNCLFFNELHYWYKEDLPISLLLFSSFPLFSPFLLLVLFSLLTSHLALWILKGRTSNLSLLALTS
jgi:hypothetical protein